MALHPEADSAIEDIVNEAVVSDTNDSPVEIELSNLNASDGIKKYRFVKSSNTSSRPYWTLIKRHTKSIGIGTLTVVLYYHKVIDMKNPHEAGIQELALH